MLHLPKKPLKLNSNFKQNCKVKMLTVDLLGNTSERISTLKLLRVNTNDNQLMLSFRYQVMIDCWQENPSARPTFEGLKDQMKSFERDHQVGWGS